MTMAGHIQFIDLTQKSTQASEHNRQLIRSHIAKNNRRKRIPPTGQRQKHNATRARLIAPLGLSLDDGEPEATSSIAGTSSVGEQDVEEAGNTVSERSTIPSSPIRELAVPALACGAHSAIALDAADYTSFGESANFMSHVILPNAFLPPFAWFEVFCREPLVYHAFASQLNLQRILANNNSLVPSRRRMLFHKGEAIRLLNDKFSNLRDEEIEAVLIGMLVVFPEEEEVKRATSHARHLLVPHMPWANNSAIWAGNDPKSLARAIKQLVDRAGGLLNLKVHAFPKSIATGDIMLASSSYSKPLFPWLWPVSPVDVCRRGAPYLSLDQDVNVGHGFDQFAERLPAALISCLKDLAFVDRAMAESRNHRIQGFDLDLLITARDTAHHRLLMLPSYDELDELAKQFTNDTLYEFVRLTCIIYVHCVLSPMLPGCPGISGPLAEVCELVRLKQFDSKDPDLAGVLLWALLVCALAGYRNPSRGVLVEALRELVSTHSITSLEQVISVCRTFIWSDCAGLQGATVVWDLVDSAPTIVGPAENEP